MKDSTHSARFGSKRGPARTLLVEDDPAIAESFRARLGSDSRFRVVGHATGVRRARALLRSTGVELVVLDLALEDGHGTELIADATRVGAVVVVVSVYEDRDAVLQALGMGAAGYLIKSTPAAQMLDMLAAALCGEAPLSPAIAGHLLRKLRHPTSDKVALTDREQEILQCLARGCTYRETGEELGISVNTVAFHLKQTYGKLDVRSRGAAVYAAVQQGLVEL